MNQCILKWTSNPQEKHMEGMKGILTIIQINGYDYFSFITEDCQQSIRHKISKKLNDLSLPICTEAWYQTPEQYEYTFISTENQGNPLWEMEHSQFSTCC